MNNKQNIINFVQEADLLLSDIIHYERMVIEQKQKLRAKQEEMAEIVFNLEQAQTDAELREQALLEVLKKLKQII